MSLLNMTWFSIGLFLLFAVAFRQMAGGRSNVAAVLSAFCSAVGFVLRAVFSACGQIGTTVAPNNPFVALLVQLALVVALIGVAGSVLQPQARPEPGTFSPSR
jgi:cytochrome b